VTTLFILFHVLPIFNTDRVISQASDDASLHKHEQVFGFNKALYVRDFFIFKQRHF
jgi:hypothetical protein